MPVDPFSALLGAVIGRAVGAAGVRGPVSLGDTLGRAISAATGVAGGGGRSALGGGDGGKLPDEVVSLLKQPLRILMPDLPKVAYQPILQGAVYRATNEKGEAVGEGFKNVLDSIAKMDEMITAHRARFISERTGVPLMVNAAGDIVRGARAGAGGDGASSLGGVSNIAGLVSMLVGRAGASAAAGGAGAGAGAAGAGAAAGGAGAAGAAGAAALANPVTAALIVVGAVGAAAAAAPFAIRNWTESILQSQQGLRRFNGQISIAFAEFERRDLLRRKGRADATSGSTSALADAVSDLADEAAPIINSVSTIINLLGTGAARAAQVIVQLEKMHPLIALGIKILEKIEDSSKRQEQLPTLKWFDDLADGKYSGYDRTRRARQQQAIPGGRP